MMRDPIRERELEDLLARTPAPAYPVSVVEEPGEVVVVTMRRSQLEALLALEPAAVAEELDG